MKAGNKVILYRESSGKSEGEIIVEGGRRYLVRGGERIFIGMSEGATETEVSLTGDIMIEGGEIVVEEGQQYLIYGEYRILMIQGANGWTFEGGEIVFEGGKTYLLYQGE